MSTGAQTSVVDSPAAVSRPALRLSLALMLCCTLIGASRLGIEGAAAWLLAAMGVAGVLGLAAPWLLRSVQEDCAACWLPRLAVASAVVGVGLHGRAEAPLALLAGSAAMLAGALAQIALPHWFGFNDTDLPPRAPSLAIVALAVTIAVASLLLGQDLDLALQRAVALAVFADPASRAWRRGAVDAVLRRRLQADRVPGVDSGMLDALGALDRLGVSPSLLADDAGMPRPGAHRFLEELASFGIEPAAPRAAAAALLPGGTALRVGARSIPLDPPGFIDCIRLLDLARVVAWRREQGLLWVGILQGAGILLVLAGLLGPVGAVALELGALLYTLLNAQTLDRWRPMQQQRIAAIVVRPRCGGA